MKKNVYIRCPRCELNYILKKDKFCNVCKSEMQARGERYEDLDMELCPICHTNFLNGDEQICEACREEGGYDYEYDDDDKEWRRYIGEEEEMESENEEIGDNASVIDIDDDHLDYEDDDFMDFGKSIDGEPIESFDIDESESDDEEEDDDEDDEDDDDDYDDDYEDDDEDDDKD